VKKSTSIPTSIGKRRGATRRDATIYRYSINHFGSYLGVLARDKSLNGRIPAERDGTKQTIRMKYNGADENFSGQKRAARAFPRRRRRRIRELASQKRQARITVRLIISFPIPSHVSPCAPRCSAALKSQIYARCQE
jgi:hypothetical protein